VPDDPGVVREWTFRAPRPRLLRRPLLRPPHSTLALPSQPPSSQLTAPRSRLRMAAPGGARSGRAADGGGAASPAGPCDFSGSGDRSALRPVYGAPPVLRHRPAHAGTLLDTLCRPIRVAPARGRVASGLPRVPWQLRHPSPDCRVHSDARSEGAAPRSPPPSTPLTPQPRRARGAPAAAQCACGSAVTGVTYAVAYSAATLAITGVSAQLFLTTLSGSGQAACSGSEPLSVPFTALVRIAPLRSSPRPPVCSPCSAPPPGLGRVRPRMPPPSQPWRPPSHRRTRSPSARSGNPGEAGGRGAGVPVPL